MDPIYLGDTFFFWRSHQQELVHTNAPLWIATAFRAGIVPVNEPWDTVILMHWTSKKKKKKSTTANITHVVPVHFPEELVPLITSQYLPSGSEVEKAAFQTESSLLIATYPVEPQKNKCQYDSYTNNYNKEITTSSECNLLRLWRCPISHWSWANSIAESDHAANWRESMLAIPTVTTTIGSTGSRSCGMTSARELRANRLRTHHCWEHPDHSPWMSNWTGQLVCHMDVPTRRCLRWCMY